MSDALDPRTEERESVSESLKTSSRRQLLSKVGAMCFAVVIADTIAVSSGELLGTCNSQNPDNTPKCGTFQNGNLVTDSNCGTAKNGGGTNADSACGKKTSMTGTKYQGDANCHNTHSDAACSLTFN